MVRELGMPRSTVEKRLMVLPGAGAVERVPTLNPRGQLSISYRINDVAFRLRSALEEIPEK